MWMHKWAPVSSHVFLRTNVCMCLPMHTHLLLILQTCECVHIYKQCVRCITCMQVFEDVNVLLCVCLYVTSNCLCLCVHVFANAYAFVTHFSNMGKWVHIHYQCRMYKLYTIYMYVCEYKGVTMCVYVCYLEVMPLEIMVPEDITT